MHDDALDRSVQEERRMSYAAPKIHEVPAHVQPDWSARSTCVAIPVSRRIRMSRWRDSQGDSAPSMRPFRPAEAAHGRPDPLRRHLAFGRPPATRPSSRPRSRWSWTAPRSATAHSALARTVAWTPSAPRTGRRRAGGWAACPPLRTAEGETPIATGSDVACLADQRLAW